MVGTGASKRRLTQDLYRKGIKGDVASAAIDSAVADEEIDTGAMIERVARKKLAQLGDLEPLVLRRRLSGSFGEQLAAAVSSLARPFNRYNLDTGW